MLLVGMAEMLLQSKRIIEKHALVEQEAIQVSIVDSLLRIYKRLQS